MLIDNLLALWSHNGPERCGIILANGELQELPNLHPDPENGFAIPHETLQQNIHGTWHTHPSGYANLSVDDYRAFLSYPKLRHYVVGSESVWCFVVVKGTLVLSHEDSYSAWLSKRTAP